MDHGKTFLRHEEEQFDSQGYKTYHSVGVHSWAIGHSEITLDYFLPNGESDYSVGDSK